ncbi:YheT family hydrolase [Salegentibacter chungangensis]|uniref:YheT family hydrolase n=1 Tax=Salegentibacter chungangensis TaxID=1335724 RepID=A0ABW3NPK3_9FLAO
MPILEATYQPKGIFKSADVNTVYAATLRKVDLPAYKRERIEISDGDFLDLDWSFTSQGRSKKVVILLHGLAGSAERPYMKGMARTFNKKGWDAVAMNFRGCSEELNRFYRSYHAGASDDLAEVVTHLMATGNYENISLAGFSLGGNMMLKYLGENRTIPEEIKSAVAISVPCDLAGSLGAINRMRNFVYSKRFELKLKEHLNARAEKFPDRISKKQVSACKSLRDIDDLYTSKAHGFKNADEYYEKNSCGQFLENIKIPTLIISAKDDTFLPNSAYPIKQAGNSGYLHLEIPSCGGHVGFVLDNEEFYHEKRAIDFAMSQL